MDKKHTILIVGILLVSLQGFKLIEEPFLEKLKVKLKAYHTSYPEEKIYVQLDKPFYKPGEDVWLNVFVLNSNTHQPTGISDVVYIDLINPKGNVSSTLELVVREGTAHGDFHLADLAPGGLYKIQAYTRWMKNFGKESFFNKEIPVQRITTPRLLLKLDYHKESYGPGDIVNATVSIVNLKNEKIAGANVAIAGRLSNIDIFNSTIFSDEEGVAHINFQLPDTLNTTDGLLQVLVKTNGTFESISRSIPIVLDKVSIQFFPEGGHYIENVISTIAFKAVNEFGKGADISGAVVDKDNRVISNLESFHMGMGAFQLRPLPGEKYYVRIDTPSGNIPLFPLPEPLTSGFSLNLKNRRGGSVEWTIHSPTTTDAFLVARIHGEVAYSEKITLHNGENIVSVRTEKFPAGIAAFTLFDIDGVEQCERLVFLNSHKGLTIQLETDKQQYLPRESVKLQIKTVDNSGKPIAAKISLSVVDDQLVSFADDKQDNMLSAMLLSSEVRGEIQEPSFYFDPDEVKAASALDYLLMTQGWRRFTWKDIMEPAKTISFTPEKIKNVGGVLLNSYGLGLDSEVTLLELGGRKRIVKVHTTADGHFLFKNIDPTIPLLLLAKKPAEIVIQKTPSFSISLNDEDGTVLLPGTNEELPGMVVTADRITTQEQPTTESALNINLENDVRQLSEVVVTSFGIQDKKNIAGSVVQISENSDEGIFAASPVENSLQGRVAGVVIQPQTGNPGAQVGVMIRGLSSLYGGRAEPLYVIDGHPIGTSLSQNFSNGSLLGPGNILSIEVITSPEATSLYGSGASNGAILITTRSRLGYSQFKSSRKPTKFSSTRVNPRKFSATREFYIPPVAANGKQARTDFRTTVYWNHTIVTDKKGEAMVSFQNNDVVSAFRIAAEGFSGSGLIGRGEQVYYTELPLSLDAKIPEYLGFEDVLKLAVNVKNETSGIKQTEITLNLPEALSVQESFSRNVSVKPTSTETVWFTIKSKGKEGEFPISIKLKSTHSSDEINHIIRVRPIGFPMRLSFSAKELDKTVNFSIHDAEQNSVKAELTAFPDVISDLFHGAESILQEPHGCFEQVSSSTFPNILALQFLRQSGLANPDIEKVAMKYIRHGYDKLIAYEIRGGGFEWFGHPPAHEGLTAYGLLQFSEMKKVFPSVDEEMVARTRKWLLNRRNGKGGFKQSSGKYGLSAASEEVTNAYIIYALSETGTKDILPEYDKALTEVLKSNDMYRMALVACTAYNLGKNDDYSRLMKHFREKVQSSGFKNFKADHSLVRSYGNSLQVETIAQWCTAMMKSQSPDLLLLDQCIQQVLKYRAYGQFGSTQGTTVALKALTGYASLLRTTGDDGAIAVYVDHVVADKLNYPGDSREKLVLNNFSKSLSSGVHNLRVLFNETTNPLPYVVDVQWYTKKPKSSEDCKVNLSTSLSNSMVKVNEMVRLTAILKNKSFEGLPMTVAQIGIPAGLSLQPWQLKELQEKEAFDFYEIMNGNLILYYREMPPNGQHIINLDLKAEIPGSYLATASAAYLYYTNEFKHWVNGSSIVIREN